VNIFGEHSTSSLIVLSQVILSLQLPFAVIPLVMFTSDRRLMGEFVNPKWLKWMAWAIAAIITSISGYLVKHF
jgi:manganese transport protein